MRAECWLRQIIDFDAASLWFLLSTLELSIVFTHRSDDETSIRCSLVARQSGIYADN